MINMGAPGVNGGDTATPSSPSTPDYTPEYTWSAAGGVDGNNITGWAATVNTHQYSDEVTGPFGGSMTGKISVSSGNLFFGGTPIREGSAFAAYGSTVWIRFYAYFDSNWDWSYGTSGDGFGYQKFLRLESAGGGQSRYTLEAESVASVAKTSSELTLGADEIGSNFFNDGYTPANANYLTNSAWHSLEFVIYLRDETDADGFVRIYHNDVLEGEATGIDTVAASAGLFGVTLGNYWNGGFTQSQSMRTDEWIISVEEPDGLDATSRPIIGKDRQVADFP